MTLRRALAGYLVATHLVAGLVVGWLLWDEHRPWILLLEACVVLSAAAGLVLVRGVRMPHELVRIGTEWMREGDFSHTFRPSGTADLQRLIGLYNQMINRLREERARLQEREHLLHELLEASPSGVVISDHDGRITLVNPAAAELLGVSAAEVLGALPAATNVPLLCRLAEVPVGEARLFVLRGGRRLRCTRSSFFDRGFAREFVLMEDLTHELWISEKQAYHLLIRTLSHEVNNTLGATGSILHSLFVYASQLQEDDRGDYSEALQVAIERTGHLGAFMRRYSEVVRLPQPSLQTVDVAQLLQRMAGLMEAACREQGVRLELDVAPEVGEARMDVVQMEQVLLNVIRNAVEAAHSDGWVRIAARRQRDATVVEVLDSGEGLNDEARERLFTPFFTTKDQGQGVGLTLAREILSRHGFDFSLESPPGAPTCFRIVMRES